jgi:hypothetical protein
VCIAAPTLYMSANRKKGYISVSERQNRVMKNIEKKKNKTEGKIMFDF